VNHYVPLSGTSVLTGTFNPAATANPIQHRRFTTGPTTNRRRCLCTTQLCTLLPGMRPGEIRAVSNGTVITYVIESGGNTIVLPPLYARAANLIASHPRFNMPRQAVGFLYSQLTNPYPAVVVYTLTLSGWLGNGLRCRDCNHSSRRIAGAAIGPGCAAWRGSGIIPLASKWELLTVEQIIPACWSV